MGGCLLLALFGQPTHSDECALIGGKVDIPDRLADVR